VETGFMFARLLASRRFLPLFICQFFGALNDNFVKNALAILILYQLALEGGPLLVTLSGALFILPFFLFSSLGGELADRYDKATVARYVKGGEMVVAVFTGAGFLFASLPILIAGLFFTGTLSALFGPLKYGILPDQLAKDELVAGNALVETATFVAILGGTIGGGIAVAELAPWQVAAGVVLFALLSWVASFALLPTGERAPDLPIERNIFAGTFRLMAHLRSAPRLWRAAIAVSWFWMIGAVIIALLPSLVRDDIGGSESVVTLFLSLFTIGVAIGSVAAAKLSKERIVLMLVPIGAVLMSLFGIDLGIGLAGFAPGAELVDWRGFLSTGAGIRAAIDLVGLAAAGGLFIVPAFAFLQSEAPEAERARTIAGNNVLNSAAMVGGSVVVLGLQATGLQPATIIALFGGANLVAAVVFARILPGSLLRDAVYLIFRIAYRVEVRGLENLSAPGPAECGGRRVIAVNHTSFLDAPMVMSLLDNDPVFAIDDATSKKWWVRPFASIARTFPMNPLKPLATRSLIQLVKAGDPLVIFPEGRITVTGSIMKIYDGAALIADKAEAMVIPVRIEGLQRTLFSRLTDAQAPKTLFPKVVVTILPGVRMDVDQALVGRRRRQAAGHAMYDVLSDLMWRTTDVDKTVYDAIVDTAGVFGMRRVALDDPMSKGLSYRMLLTGAAVLGRRFAAMTKPDEVVGVFLPNAVGTAVTFLALQRHGRVPAMLNFTAGAANLVSAVKTAEIHTVLTSRAFIEKGKLEKELAALEGAARIVFLDDLRKEIGTLERLRGLLASGARSGGDAEAPAVVLFTSGSEGVPKGVVLSHRNLLSNCAQIAARFDFSPADVIFNVLPIFHSFGLTGGLLLGLVTGTKTYLYPSPLHYRVIPELVYATNATAFFGTDTFLAGYARTANPYDFRSLRFVVAGAEPVKAETRRVWMEKFGLRILEGYGITEGSPVLAVNTPMFHRPGTVGRLLPGIETRLDAVDGLLTGGRLSVRGPNIMKGYLRADEPGVIEPPTDGWHDTGDIVEIEEGGFVAIKGRAKRFAKLAGEMVSLAAVEMLAASLWPEAQHVAFAQPDPKKGERIILLTTEKNPTREAFQGHARTAKASELMVPATIRTVVEIPLLGSGKVDVVGAKKLLETEAVAS
jgi:acyl-[acyl-carrier-protein]-phospholipid O-acyltransferase/long-chain-fatty-acid--[acyl-carrier-protein] ligase